MNIKLKTFAASVAAAASLLSLTVTPVLADKPESVDENGVEASWIHTGCTTILEGNLRDDAENPISIGYDKYGYNYQAHTFRGTYDSFDRNIDGKDGPNEGPSADDKLVMHWSDSYLANVDCNGDGFLDKGLVDGVLTNGPKGWWTKKVVGDLSFDGSAKYTEFKKMGWVGPEGTPGSGFELLQLVLNDSLNEFNGVLFKIATPGFGLNNQWTIDQSGN